MTRSPSFEIALRLTEQQDYHELTRMLIRVLEGHRHIRSADVYELYGNDRGNFTDARAIQDLVIRRFARVPQREVDLHQEYGLLRCLQSGAEVEVADPDDPQRLRLLFTVKGGVGPLRVIVVEGEPGLSAQRPHIRQIAALYRNLVMLHDSRERDMLTGLLNRQTFNASILKVLEFYRESDAGDEPVDSWLAVLDIDHFKKINDRLGHLYGDEVLLRFAHLMKETFRYNDLSFRFGGEEFIVLLTETDAAGAFEALERFRKRVAAHDFGAAGQVTVSIGYAPVVHHVMPSLLIDEADKALYEAKRQGRNRTLMYLDDGQGLIADADIELF